MSTTPSISRSRPHSRRPSGHSLNFSNISVFPLTTVSTSTTSTNTTTTSSSTTQLDGLADDHTYRTINHHLVHHPRTSYIAPISAPTTPGILSPNPSSYFTPLSPASTYRNGSNASLVNSGASTPRTARSRRNSTHNPHNPHNYNGSTVGWQAPSVGVGVQGKQLQKSKSTTTLHLGDLSASAWVHRTGTILAGEARETKGQSWLVSRASSTNLVARAGVDDEDEEWYWESAQYVSQQDEGDWRRYGRMGGSRSGLSSRRGSKSRSRRASRDEGLMMRRLVKSTTNNTASCDKPTSSAIVDDNDASDISDIEQEYTDAPTGPHDFWEGEPDSEYLLHEKGYGLGMWVDRIIGWSLFSLEEEDDEEEEYRRDPYGYHGVSASRSRRRAAMVEAGEKARGIQEMQRREKEKEREEKLKEEKERDGEAVGEEDGNGWGDPTWLFSLAAQMFF